MKFYNIDLTKLIPHGIPLNTSSSVEYRNHINDFFLKGFENWFKQLFTVDAGVLQMDYSRSCSAPNSIFSCEYCTDAQIADKITEAGFIYYPENAHEVNANFLYNIHQEPYNTTKNITAIVQYASNTLDVDARTISEEPNKFDVVVWGDITSALTDKTITRMLENLDNMAPAGMKWVGISFEDISDLTSPVYAGVAVDQINTNYSTEMAVPPDLTTLSTVLQYSIITAAATNVNVLQGTFNHNHTYTATDFSSYDVAIPVLWNMGLEGDPSYPLLGYESTFARYRYNRSYLCNNRALPRRFLRGGMTDPSVKFLTLMNATLNEYDIKSLTPKTFWFKGIRQPVVEIEFNSGYKRYLLANNFEPTSYTLYSKAQLRALNILEERHFLAYVSADGLQTGVYYNDLKLYYRLKDADNIEYPFLYDDAYDYEIEGLYREEGTSYFDMASSTKIEIDYDGNPIDYTQFNFSYGGSHYLNVNYGSGTIPNVSFVKFKLKPRELYLEGWPAVYMGGPKYVDVDTVGSTVGFYKYYETAGQQPGGIFGEDDYGTFECPVAIYYMAPPTPDDTLYRAPINFMNVTELQAFLGSQNSATRIAYSNHIWSETGTASGETTVQKFYSSNETRYNNVLFCVIKFSSINTPTLNVIWNTGNKKVYIFNPMPSALKLGTTSVGYGAKTYQIVDVSAGNPSDFVCKYIADANSQRIEITYTGEEVLQISSLTFKATFIDE